MAISGSFAFVQQKLDRFRIFLILSFLAWKTQFDIRDCNVGKKNVSTQKLYFIFYLKNPPVTPPPAIQPPLRNVVVRKKEQNNRTEKCLE